MIPFSYERVDDVPAALEALAEPGATILAGGTTLVDLMRGGVLRPRRIVDIGRIEGLDGIDVRADGISIGALARMADVAEHPVIRRSYAAIGESLSLAASQQLRNMATMGGNLLQRTRCPYFRDPGSPCNKRRPGSGCPGLDGANRDLAVLGSSDSCIATYPGDLAIALVAFDAEVAVQSGSGIRSIRAEQLHREPGDSPDLETCLAPDELIVSIFVPASRVGGRSTYLKVRDRWSYAFAIASAAVALEIENDVLLDARIAVGGLATRPWRCRDAENVLKGARLTEDLALEAGHAAFRAARTYGGNRHKPEIGARTIARAVLTAAGREPG